jgi:hypothetical protein
MSIILDGNIGLTYPDVTTQNTSSVVSGKQPFSQMPAGTVLQAVSNTTSTQVTATNSTFADTTLTVTITPKFSTSKILVVVNQNGLTKSAGDTQGCVSVQLVRNSTSLGLFSKYTTYTNTTLTNSAAAGFSYLDSPATTSATIYKTQFCVLTNVAAGYCQDSSTVSSITVMEIAA